MMVLMMSSKRDDGPHDLGALHDILAFEVTAISAQAEFLELMLKEED